MVVRFLIILPEFIRKSSDVNRAAAHFNKSDKPENGQKRLYRIVHAGGTGAVVPAAAGVLIAVGLMLTWTWAIPFGVEVVSDFIMTPL